jgi:hypothetical protein
VDCGGAWRIRPCVPTGLLPQTEILLQVTIRALADVIATACDVIMSFF